MCVFRGSANSSTLIGTVIPGCTEYPGCPGCLSLSLKKEKGETDRSGLLIQVVRLLVIHSLRSLVRMMTKTM